MGGLMIKLKKIISTFLLSLVFLLGLTSAGSAETTVSAEVQYIFNTFSFLVCGFLVMWMAAGFCMLESGLVTTKSVSTIVAKNIGKFSIVAIIFYLGGYNLAYGIPEGGFIGSFTPWTLTNSLEQGYSGSADWFFSNVIRCSNMLYRFRCCS